MVGAIPKAFREIDRVYVPIIEIVDTCLGQGDDHVQNPLCKDFYHESDFEHDDWRRFLDFCWSSGLAVDSSLR
jgi:hypothetical protein